MSSVGLVRGPSLPETVTGMTHVCVFRHALALDELRVKFLPEYANGGHGLSDPTTKGDVKEVWFAGSHSDMYVLCKNSCFETPTDGLKWWRKFTEP